jgi:hypothetical protein
MNADTESNGCEKCRNKKPTIPISSPKIDDGFDDDIPF